MFNGSVSLTKNDKKTDSYGRILGTKCVRNKIADLYCVASQRVYDTHRHFIEKGWEGKKEVYRFDLRLSSLIPANKLNIADYLEYVDTLGVRHEYKIIDFETRNILGCIWVTLYGENLTARDIKNDLHTRKAVTTIP